MLIMLSKIKMKEKKIKYALLATIHLSIKVEAITRKGKKVGQENVPFTL